MRELKLWQSPTTNGSAASHPLRVRELKLRWNILGQLTRFCRTLYGCVNWNQKQCWEKMNNQVAPFTGAWIETSSMLRRERCKMVAPFTGAWIETQCHHITHHQTNLSHPLRVRELKRHPQSTTPMAYRSHPLRVRELKHRPLRSQKTRRRRTLYGCVNWNFVLRICSYQFVWSHPLRVRELKPLLGIQSRPVNVAPFTGAWIETCPLLMIII